MCCDWLNVLFGVSMMFLCRYCCVSVVVLWLLGSWYYRNRFVFGCSYGVMFSVCSLCSVCWCVLVKCECIECMWCW